MGQNDDHIGQEADDLSGTLDAGKPLYEIGGHVGNYKLLRVLGRRGHGNGLSGGAGKPPPA